MKDIDDSLKFFLAWENNQNGSGLQVDDEERFILQEHYVEVFDKMNSWRSRQQEFICEGLAFCGECVM